MDKVMELLKGACDMHLHSGPSLVPRSVDDVEAIQAYSEAGMLAMVIKDQYFMSTQRAHFINKYIFKGTHTTAYGSIALNNSVGGLSPHAVDAAIRSGAKVVWMPTVSAERHIERAKERAKKGLSHIVGIPVPAKPLYTEIPLKIIDENGALLSQIPEICRLVAEADIVLGSGHITVNETRILIEEAKRQGVKKIVVDHPNILGYTKEDIMEMAGRGAMIELVAAVALAEPGGIEEIVGLIKMITPEKVVLVTDLGQPAAPFPLPIIGIKDLIKKLLDSGIEEQEIETMFKKNPKRLLNLD
jgi:hypothetical protein